MKPYFDGTKSCKTLIRLRAAVLGVLTIGAFVAEGKDGDRAGTVRRPRERVFHQNRSDRNADQDSCDCHGQGNQMPARTPLRPGRYDLWVGVFERQRLQAANLRTTIEVPDLGGALSVGSALSPGADAGREHLQQVRRWRRNKLTKVFRTFTL